MNNIINTIESQVNVSQCVFPGGQDRAMQGCNLSGLPARRGKCAGFFISPDGAKAINPTNKDDSMSSLFEGSAILDSPTGTNRHFERKCPVHAEDPSWRDNREWLQEKKDKIYSVLLNAGRNNEAEKVKDCCNTFIGFIAVCCGDTVAFPCHCGHRLCPVCQGRRQRDLTDRLRFFLGKMQSPRHIVLTVKNVSHINKAYFNKLRGYLKKLRHRKIFQECRGGVYRFETSHNAKSKTWHVHLHILADIRYLPRSGLSKEWCAITGGSWSVESKLLGTDSQSLESAVHEITKYFLKAGQFLEDSDLVNEYLDTVSHMRLYEAFGFCRGLKYESEDSSFPDCACHVGAWSICHRVIPLAEVFRDTEGFLD